MNTNNLYEMPVLTSGTKKDLFGRKAKITKQVLDDMANSYDPENIFESQIVIGHKEDLKKMLQNDQAPSYGQMLSLEVKEGTKKDPNSGYTLYSTVDLTDVADKWVSDKHYRHRSMAYYEPDHPDNPKPGHYYPRHLALLGLSAPSDKNLGEPVKLDNVVKLSETNNASYLMVSLAEEADGAEKIIDAPAFDADPEEILAFMKENASDMFISVLTEGNFGFKGEIMGFIPPPDEENNFLRDEETGIISGKFVDDEDEVYLFEIDPQTNKKSFTPENKEDEPSDNDEDPGINRTEEQDLKTFSEYGNGHYMLNTGSKVYCLVVCEPSKYGKAMGMIPALADKNSEFVALTDTQIKGLREGMMEEEEKPLESMMTDEEKEEMKALKEFKANAERQREEKEDQKLTAFAESLFDQGKLLKTEVSTSQVVGLLKILKSAPSEETNIKAFSEPSVGDKTTPFGLAKKILEGMSEKIKLNDIVSLAETTNDGKKVKVDKSLQLPRGGVIDAESNDLHTRAIALCEKTEGLEYIDAVAMVVEES